MRDQQFTRETAGEARNIFKHEGCRHPFADNGEHGQKQIARIVRFPGGTNFARSALQPVEGVFHAARMLDCAWQELWPRFSETPARWMGLPHGLSVG